NSATDDQQSAIGGAEVTVARICARGRSTHLRTSRLAWTERTRRALGPKRAVRRERSVLRARAVPGRPCTADPLGTSRRHATRYKRDLPRRQLDRWAGPVAFPSADAETLVRDRPRDSVAGTLLCARSRRPPKSSPATPARRRPRQLPYQCRSQHWGSRLGQT